MPVECATPPSFTHPTGSTLTHELEDTDLRGLADFDLIEALRAAHRMAGWAAAVELAAVSELDRRRIAEAKALGTSEQLASEFVIDELATALHLTDSAAAIRAAIAWKLTGPLAGTARALAEGRIDFDKVRTICDAVTGLTHADMTAVQDQILDAAERCTVGQLRPLLRKAIAAIAPEQDERRTRDAEDSRRVELWPTPDGTVDLSGRDLPEADAHAAFNRITALAKARKSDGDTRCLDQVRADVFVECLRGIIPATIALPLAPTNPATPPTTKAPNAANRGNSKPANQTGCHCRAGEDPVAEVAAQMATRAQRGSAVLPLPTDTAKPTNTAKWGSSKPANRTGCDCGAAEDPVGAVAAQIAVRARGELAAALAGTPAGKRALLAVEAGERIRRALHDLATPWCSAGVSGGHGHDSYRPPAALRRQVMERDGRCMAPSCRRPAHQADLDHTMPFHRGGATCACNLAVLCRHHHRLKQRPGWRVIHLWPGILLWITPAGHWRITGPADHR